MNGAQIYVSGGHSWASGNLTQRTDFVFPCVLTGHQMAVAQADMLECPEWTATALTIEAARGAL